MDRGFFVIENVLQKRRAQYNSVKGKEVPFRVEFRYRGGTKHWQYFETYQDCLSAEDSSCRYGIFGNAIIEYPSSSQIQRSGVRGGWSKYKTSEQTNG